MSSKEKRPDTPRILSGLKDFQRRSVEHVFRRMFLDPDCTRRFLLADEVGLGKTMVARGLIAKAIDHLWKTVRRIDIIYICSNADIARQNIQRLNVLDESEFTLPDRITLLPEKVHDLEKNRINFVAFTPGTSFHLKSSTGRYEERALLYRLLCGHWGFRGKAPVNVLTVNAYPEYFENTCAEYMSGDIPIDGNLERAFLRELDRCIADQKRRQQPDYHTQFRRLCEVFNRRDARVSSEDRRQRDTLIGELRSLLASVCIEALDPNLIILDEFQRFKHLFDAETDAGLLAQNLFRYANEYENSQARVLLLSATPYKMFSMRHESGDEDHYEDFLDTLRFLLDDPVALDEVRSLLAEYGAQFYQHGGPDERQLLRLKTELESRLRRVMARTERLTCSEDRSGMLRQVRPRGEMLQSRDLHAYVQQAGVAEYLGHPSVMEYWKSAPYLLNFMDEYMLKRKFKREAMRAGGQELAALLGGRRGALLKWGDISGYRQLDPANAKLRALLSDTVDQGMWRLLWMPPSLPYYGLQGAFANAADAGMTKRLIFSCWNVVPKVVAALASYEAERRAILSLDAAAKNSVVDRKNRRPLLRFARSDERLTGMPVLGMIYPATVLSRLCDPLTICQSAGGTMPSMDCILGEARAGVERECAGLGRWEDAASPVDERWYWAAPVLMDLAADSKRTTQWFEQDVLMETWRRHGKRSAADEEHSGRWGDHVLEMCELASAACAGTLVLGRMPEDLADVLSRLGVGGFGCCSLRALSRLAGGLEWPDTVVLNEAGALAHAFLSLFNLPEAMAIVRGLDDREPYWLRVAEYCSAGCLQSVMDEYAHILRESLGLIDTAPDKAIPRIGETMASALSIRTSRVKVDHIRAGAKKGITLDPRQKTMRIRFSMRFGSDLSEDGAEATREDHVRAAFNSPFWPFILASTSIGQEGLDFHAYCHAVVHWNLPSNPVDLEQREGRIHRYKGHAVRKNVARAFAAAAWRGRGGDPWASLFEAARQARPAASEIEPYWVFPLEGGACIERHILNLPLSRDEERLSDLRRSLAVYRMIFGQPRQEDLLAFLLEKVPESDRTRLAEQLRIDLEPPCHPEVNDE